MRKLNSLLGLRLLLCILVASTFVYTYIDKQNSLTELRLAIPLLTKEVKRIQDANVQMYYEIEQFESPIHLMELARKPEFGHLKYPYVRDVLILEAKREGKRVKRREREGTGQ